MSEPVCQLDDFHFTRLAVQWHNLKEPGKYEVNYSFDYNIGQHKTDKNRYRLAFRVGAKSDTPEPVGYHLDTEIVGFFRFPDGTEQKKMDFLIRVNGCSVLYGILRGQVASLTGSFPQKKLVLPTLMMKEIIEGVEHQKVDNAKTKKTAPKPTSRKKVQVHESR
jgi:preprotein translocase subunit SecB